MTDTTGSPTAVSITASMCENEVVALELRDVRGNVFARAAVPLMVWMQITSDLVDDYVPPVPGNPGGRMQ